MNKKILKICNRSIGEDFPPLVIAEIGINHEGSLAIAMELVDAAISAGAEFIKHQTHVIEDEMIPAAKNIVPGNSNKSIYEIMERCALSENDEIKLKLYVESKGAVFLSTPFSRAAADRLEKMDVCAYKIGSGECNNYPLIEHIASFGKPMILSTGMNDISAIKKAVKIMKNHQVDFSLLHTTNIYPTPPKLVRLGAMQELQKEFPSEVIGLSDHTTSNLACFAAVALGASILERHFIDSFDRPGPDIINSMDPLQLKELIDGSQEIFLMRGGEKKATIEEQATINFAFATVVSIENICKGEKFTKNNIWVKRPGTGPILAEKYKSLLGARASCDININEHIKPSDIEGFIE